MNKISKGYKLITLYSDDSYDGSISGLTEEEVKIYIQLIEYIKFRIEEIGDNAWDEKEFKLVKDEAIKKYEGCLTIWRHSYLDILSTLGMIEESKSYDGYVYFVNIFSNYIVEKYPEDVIWYDVTEEFKYE